MGRRAALVALFATASLAAPARGEGIGEGEGRASTAKRIYGAAFLRPFAGGLIAAGGASLRYLPPGGKSWTTLFTQKGLLSRVAYDEERARLLAVWENDPVLHLLAVRERAHSTFPLAAIPRPHGTQIFSLHTLDFAPDGTAALAYSRGPLNFRGTHAEASSAFRVPLDGKSEPHLLWENRGIGDLVWTSGRGALYILSESPERRGSWRAKFDGVLTAFIVDGETVTRKPIYGGQEVKFRSVKVLSGSTPDRMVMLVTGGRGNHGLLIYRFGDDRVEYQDLPPGPGPAGIATVVQRTHELEYVIDRGLELEIVRRPLAANGEPQSVRIWPASGPPIRVAGGERTLASRVHTSGVRADQTSYMQIGDDLALIGSDGNIRGVDLAKLVGGQPEWTGAVYIAKPEGLWLAIEVGPSRDFVRVPFAELERRAKPWPSREDRPPPAVVRPNPYLKQAH